MHILLADDDMIARMALLDVLKSLPELIAHEAADGDEAWQILSSGLQPVLCLLDVRMPGLDGMGLLRKLREEVHLRDIPVIFISAASDKDTVVDSIKLKAASYIVKPFTPAETYKRIQQVLEESKNWRIEPLADALKRLSINKGRYVTYLEALITQTQDVQQSLKQANEIINQSVLERIKTSCITLGLWHGTRIVDAITDTRDTRSEMFSEGTLLGHLTQHLHSYRDQLLAK